MKKVIKKEISGLPNANSILDYCEIPRINGQEYKHRIKVAFSCCEKSITHLIIYADREHFSNLEYFTGYDPRFEEALLVLEKDGASTLIVGNEGYSYAKRIPYDINIAVFPTFSLPSQPKNKKIILSDILKKTGINRQSKIGIIGWKCFNEDDYENFQNQFDTPYFIMKEILDVTDEKNISNATNIMVGNKEGLRNYLDPKELILCEISGTKSSRSVLALLSNLKVGMNELEASKYLAIDGDPLGTHPNVNFGDNIFYGLASPTANCILKEGDIVGAGISYRRSMIHKVSYFVNDGSKLNPQYDQLYNVYFQAITKWYETMDIEITGGEIYKAVEDALGSYSEMGVGLNPGHLIHTDEWTNSPFTKESNIKIRSGMAIQCDFTAALPRINFCVHAEDGIIIADNQRQSILNKIAPKSYQRMKMRQMFMRDVLGIQINDCVLPTSDMPAVVFPYLQNLNCILANE